MSCTAPERLLLDALLLPSPLAEDAWRRWRSSTDLDALDNGSFHLLPALTERMPAWIDGDPRRAILLGICRRAWSQNQLQRKLLADAVQILAAAGIERVAATGPVVWGTLFWPAGAIRPIGMVDLLVEPAAVRRAFEAMTKAGWQAQGAIPDARAKQFPFAAGALLASPSGTVRIHWRALPNTNLSLRRPEFPPLAALPSGAGAGYTILPEHALVAALGGVHDDGVGWHLDSLMICRHPGLDWQKAAALLRRRATQRKRLEQLRSACSIEIPRLVTAPAWTHGMEQILASALRAYRRLGIE